MFRFWLVCLSMQIVDVHLCNTFNSIKDGKRIKEMQYFLLV